MDNTRALNQTLIEFSKITSEYSAIFDGLHKEQTFIHGQDNNGRKNPLDFPPNQNKIIITNLHSLNYKN